MSRHQHRRDNLADLISDMECDVCDLIRWATVVSELGTSDNCDREGVQVVGAAMEDVAKRVKEGWSLALEMSRCLREVAR